MYGTSRSNFQIRCRLSTRSILGVGSSNFGGMTFVRPIKIMFLKNQSSFLYGSHRRPPWSRSGRHQNSLSYQVSRLIFSASEPIFAFGPASDRRPRGSWGGPHTTEEQRQPSLTLLHDRLSCNLGVAPSSITLTRLAASNSAACLFELELRGPRGALQPSHMSLDDTCIDRNSEGSGMFEGGWANMKDNSRRHKK